MVGAVLWIRLVGLGVLLDATNAAGIEDFDGLYKAKVIAVSLKITSWTLLFMPFRNTMKNLPSCRSSPTCA